MIGENQAALNPSAKVKRRGINWCFDIRREGDCERKGKVVG